MDISEERITREKYDLLKNDLINLYLDMTVHGNVKCAKSFCKRILKEHGCHTIVERTEDHIGPTIGDHPRVDTKAREYVFKYFTFNKNYTSSGNYVWDAYITDIVPQGSGATHYRIALPVPDDLIAKEGGEADVIETILPDEECDDETPKRKKPRKR
jgi:hypothetical protein